MTADRLPIRADLAGIPLYSPSVLDGLSLDLRDNINLWGTAPAALASLRAATDGLLRDYPTVSAGKLTAALAESLGVTAANVVAGCGSDDVIDACFRAVGSAATGDGARARIAHADPSFSMVPVFARLNGLEPVAVPLQSDGSMDVGALIATGAPIIYACSPNNPTGTVTSRAELLRLFDAAPGLVLLDEAYGEFTDAHDLRQEAARRENVLVTRTFSKAWGMAGLRIGYGIGGATLVASVTKARGPYKVNALAERAASAAMVADGDWMRRVAGEMREVRDRAADALRGRRGVRVWPSEGNFLFLELTDSRATDAAERFRRAGIGVRAFAGLQGIGESLRIGLAPWPEMERVLAVAAELWP